MKSIWIPALILSGAFILFLMIRMPDQPTVQFVDGPTITVEIADDLAEQTVGLSGHAPLDDAHGMLFVWQSKNPRTFWMKDMTFAIDILWIADGKVIGIERAVQPPSNDEVSDSALPLYHSPTSADQVLEVAAGWTDRQGIVVGDRLTVGLP